jgi:hypothetical protein
MASLVLGGLHCSFAYSLVADTETGSLVRQPCKFSLQSICASRQGDRGARDTQTGLPSFLWGTRFRCCQKWFGHTHHSPYPLPPVRRGCGPLRALQPRTLQAPFTHPQPKTMSAPCHICWSYPSIGCKTGTEAFQVFDHHPAIGAPFSLAASVATPPY